MRNTSFEILPEIYLVPQRFHFPVKTPTQLRCPDYTNLNNYLNIRSEEDCNCPVKYNEEICLVVDENSNTNASVSDDQRYLRLNGVIPQEIEIKKTKSIFIVSKAIISERITQFQMITSRKYESINNEMYTKWRSVESYERPKQPFNRYDKSKVIYKEPTLKSSLLDNLNDNNIETLNTTKSIFYYVTSANDESVFLTSIIDPSIDTAFLPLLQLPENDQQWNDILILFENQLNQNFKKMSVLIASYMAEKR